MQRTTEVTTADEAARAYRLASDALNGYEDGSRAFNTCDIKTTLGGALAANKWWANIRDSAQGSYWKDSHIDCLVVASKLMMIWCRERARPSRGCLPLTLSQYAEAWLRYFDVHGEADGEAALFGEMANLASLYDAAVNSSANFALAMPPALVGV